MSAASDALAEINAALVELAPIHEGMRDYAVLDLQPETKEIVNSAVLRYDRRRDALNAAKAALEALLADQYPDIPVTEIPEAAYADLAANQSTITAALGKFAPPNPAASSLGLTSGAPQPKGSSGKSK